MKWTFYISILLKYLLLQAVNATGSCPQHLASVAKSKSFIHRHICYLFVDNEVYWKQAREKCWSLGGEMLSIENEDTMNFIKQKLNSPELGWQRNGVWLGAQNRLKSWKWTNGRELIYTNWAPGEPSRWLGVMSVEDCVLMRQKEGWKWSDNVCGSLKFHYNYICQFPLIKPEESNIKILSEAQQYVNDNGYSTILTVIVSLCSFLLFLMLFVFLMLYYRFKSLKLKAAAGSVHYTNNTSVATDSSTYHGSTLTVETSYASQPPEPPRSQPPAVMPLHETPPYTEVVKPNNHLVKSNVFHQVQETNLLESQGACGGSDPELDLRTPLIKQDTVSSSNSDLGQYIDMRSVSSRASAECLMEDKHTYSNVDHKAEENLYEVLP
ncbi:C-type lectin lectoxin-Lio3 [Biomphalaria pfeifferi]|uniref:C-type lectin lectoxin-Lio3 n=1 Tax=Biomphalaria pfeifferi TaxID=112525 RepID=A0AAD8B883_BIOPF|nr:C-type lectin lectoxin-Lio3 [Biomphalaria pfeifferi]